MKLKVFVLENNSVKRTRHAETQKAVREYLGGDQKIRVEYDDKGKPSVVGTEKKWHISVTTTGDVMLVALATQPVGIDGEYLPRFSAPDNKIDYVALAERFFSEDEADYIRDCNDPAERFVKVWTRKEAYVKCAGKTLVDFPSFSVVEGDRLVGKLRGVPIKKFGITFPGSENYLFVIAGVE